MVLENRWPMMVHDMVHCMVCYSFVYKGMQQPYMGINQPYIIMHHCMGLNQACHKWVGVHPNKDYAVHCSPGYQGIHPQPCVSTDLLVNDDQ